MNSVSMELPSLEFSFFKISVMTLCLAVLSSTESRAEIYTYEKDGVIIISSEPPPRPRRRRLGKKSRSNRNSESRVRLKRREVNHPKKPRRKSEKLTKSDLSKNDKKSPLRLPWRLKKQRAFIEKLSMRYHLPPRLLPSVSLSCLAGAKEVKQSHSSFDEGLEYTCLKQESRDVIQNQLARMSTHQPLLVDAKSQKNMSLLAQSLEKSAWLLRKLINRYHGDLTLAIASYYEASQDHKHSVYGYHSISEQDLTLAMNKFSQKLDKALEVKRPKAASIEFTRRALSLWRGQ